MGSYTKKRYKNERLRSASCRGIYLHNSQIARFHMKKYQQMGSNNIFFTNHTKTGLAYGLHLNPNSSKTNGPNHLDP
jgi:hypothetical protein